MDVKQTLIIYESRAQHVYHSVNVCEVEKGKEGKGRRVTQQEREGSREEMEGERGRERLQGGREKQGF